MKSTQQSLFTPSSGGLDDGPLPRDVSGIGDWRAAALGLAALLLVLFGTSACSKDAVLEAVRQHAESHYDTRRQERLRECELRLSEPERERCRRELPPASFEEYERVRRTVPR